MENNIYKTPLSGRYASQEMNQLWSNNSKYTTWRKLWIALAETEKELGIDITDEQIEEMKEKAKGKKCDIQRYKGLGEMNADQLCDTTMKPGTRALIRVNIEDAQLAEKRVSVLMGDDVPPRKEWIDENVEFTLEDEYEI